MDTIEAMVVTGETETESCCELFSSLPCDTGTEAHSPTFFVNQADITSQIQEQRELLANGATHVTDVRLKGQFVGNVNIVFSSRKKSRSYHTIEAVASTKSNLPLIIDDVTNFRVDVKSCVVFINLTTDTAADPPTLSVD